MDSSVIIKKDMPPVFWHSKKFIAYLVATVGWKVLMIWMLIARFDDAALTGGWWTLFFGMIITDGVIQVGYLGGQTWIDRYTMAIRIPVEVGRDAIESIVDRSPGGGNAEIPSERDNDLL